MKAVTERLTTYFGDVVDIPLTGWVLDSEKTQERGGAALYFINDITGDRKITHGGHRWGIYDMDWLAQSDNICIIHRALGSDFYTKAQLEEMAHRSQHGFKPA